MFRSESQIHRPSAVARTTLGVVAAIIATGAAAPVAGATQIVDQTVSGLRCAYSPSVLGGGSGEVGSGAVRVQFDAPDAAIPGGTFALTNSRVALTTDVTGQIAEHFGVDTLTGYVKASIRTGAAADAPVVESGPVSFQDAPVGADAATLFSLPMAAGAVDPAGAWSVGPATATTDVVFDGFVVSAIGSSSTNPSLPQVRISINCRPATAPGDVLVSIPLRTDLPTLTLVNPSTATAYLNQWVTLRGTNLTGVRTVSFGQARALIYFVQSSTAIRAFTPSLAAGTYPVTVTVTGGYRSPVVPEATLTVRPLF